MSKKVSGSQYATATATAISDSPFSLKTLVNNAVTTAKKVSDIAQSNSPVSEGVKALTNHIQNMSRTDMSLYMIYIFIGLIFILYVCLLYYYLVFLHTYKTSDTDNTVMDGTPLNSVNPDSNDSTNNIAPTLSDYFIKGAYNCCSTGDYKNGYVSIDQLNYILSQGVRFLDFEIMSIDGQPVVATSTNDDVYIKESFNYIPFSQVMDTIKNNAFTLAKVSNYNDPIILHLRMHSNDQAMYDNFALLLENYDYLLLSPKYSYSNNMTNFANTSLKDLMKKISIIIDVGEGIEITEDFSEMVNMTSRSPFLQESRSSTMKSNTNVEEEIEYNKTNFTVVLPNNGANPPNPDSNSLRNYGIQVIAMRYQLKDGYLEQDIDHKSAFVLKPPELRPVIEVTEIAPQNPEVAYGRKPVNLGFGIDAVL
jgi:Phosphatidylinositol-specific phospholipase C, X domain